VARRLRRLCWPLGSQHLRIDTIEAATAIEPATKQLILHGLGMLGQLLAGVGVVLGGFLSRGFNRFCELLHAPMLLMGLEMPCWLAGGDHQ